jgi:hypothetical protein
MKTRTLFFEAVLLLFCSNALFAQFAGGNGTPADPYQISTRGELEEVKNYLSSDFIVMNDIDLSGGNWTTMIGSIDTPFSGTFNGNGKIISNVTIVTESWWSGFFSYATGVIKNIYLKDMLVTGTSILGGLVGQIDGATIMNCAVSGSITGTGNIIGGIIGCIYNNGGTVLNCWADVDVSGSITVGSIIAQCNNNATVSNCISMGSVKAEGRGAGMIAYFGNDEIAAPVNTVSGMVAINNDIERTSTWGGPEHFGRIIGTRNGTEGSLSDNLAGENVVFTNLDGKIVDAGLTTKDGATKTDLELKQELTYSTVGFDFGTNESAPWYITSNTVYPVLWFTDRLSTETSNNEIIKQNIKLYPNPTINTLTIEGLHVKGVKVFNMLGKLMGEYTSSLINVENLADGQYYLQIMSDEGMIRAAFIKR